MRALVIAPQPFFTPRGTPFSVYYRTLITSELGVNIDLLTYGQGQDVEIPGVRIIRIPNFPFLGEVKTGPSPLKLFLDVFIFFWTIALLLRNRYHFVHAHEEAIFFCRFLKPIFRFKLIYDMHSSLPQQLTNFNFTKSRLIIGLFKKLEDTSIHASDAIITICPALADYVNSLDIDKNKHFLIENSIFDDVKTISKIKDDSSLSISESMPVLQNDKKLVVYTGTLEHYQGIDILINAFQNVLSEVPDAFLVIVGGSQEQVDKYTALANQQGLQDKCIFTGRLPQFLAREYNKKADVLLSPRSEGTNTPLKVYEQLASGTPLVATNIYSHTQVLDDDVAFLVKPNPESMAKGIIKALRDDNEASIKTTNAKKLYDEKYSRQAYVTKMKKLMKLVGVDIN